METLVISALQARQRRLGPADIKQIRLLLRMPPETRIRTMLNVQNVVLNTWRTRLRIAHPELSELEVCRLMFQRLKQNG